MAEYEGDDPRAPMPPGPPASPAADYTPDPQWRREPNYPTSRRPGDGPPVQPPPLVPPGAAARQPPQPPASTPPASTPPPRPDDSTGPVAPVRPREPGDDDELSDTLAIDAAVDDHEAAVPGVAPVPSLPPRLPRSGRHRRPDADLSRFEAAHEGQPLPPLPSGPPSQLSGDPAGMPPGVPPGDARAAEKAAKKDAKPRKKAPWWELPVLIVVAILIAILVKTFVVQPFYIPSASMEKTLAGSSTFGHDRILVNKPIYDLRDPHPGDIVVFHAPPGWNQEQPSRPPSNPVFKAVRGFGQLIGFVPPDGLVLVKRVIAVGGQTVKGVDGKVMVSKNGAGGPWVTLNEPYVFNGDDSHPNVTNADSHANFGPVTVPKGRLWVMGDHRSDSADSRYHCTPAGDNNFGPDCDATSSTVPVNDVIGKAFVVAWPPSHWRTLGTPGTFKHLAQGAPITAGLLVIAPLAFVRRRRRRRRAA